MIQPRLEDTYVYTSSPTTWLIVVAPKELGPAPEFFDFNGKQYQQDEEKTIATRSRIRVQQNID